MKSSARTVDVVLGRPELLRLWELLQRFSNWWLAEFLNLFPERVAARLSGDKQTMLAIAVDDQGVRLELLGNKMEPVASSPVSHPERTAEEMIAFLRARHIERHAAQIGLRLPANRVFGRQLVVPSQAAHAIGSIVAQDLARKTPFRPDDVFADYAIAERIGGAKLRIVQWIARRQDVRNALAPFKIAVEDLAFLLFARSVVGELPPTIRLQRESSAAKAWLPKAMVAACLAALLLAGAASGLRYWNQKVALESLDSEIAILNRKAQQVRGMVDQLQEKKGLLLRVRMQRSDAPRLIELWDEVTRILPSHSWLTELKIIETAGGRETQLNLSGFSNAAPSLVGIIDRSPLFVEASLSAPVIADPVEGRERFALQAKLRRPDLTIGDKR
jgi:general secretion pathway protein L